LIKDGTYVRITHKTAIKDVRIHELACDLAHCKI